jgi:pyruvate/2-oxoglutarate dehydrogenase complex dihydrolipoamide dehydrogenase (E3) component
VLKDFDKEVVNYLMLALAERGVEVMTDTVVNSVVVKQGVKEVRLVRGNEVLTVGVDEVFNASVCNPRLDVLGGLNIKLRDGYVWVDVSLRTSVGNIYAAGDVTGISTYAHTAIVRG